MREAEGADIRTLLSLLLHVPPSNHHMGLPPGSVLSHAGLATGTMGSFMMRISSFARRSDLPIHLKSHLMTGDRFAALVLAASRPLLFVPSF